MTIGDTAFIKRSDEWPRHPICCLKRNTDRYPQQCGYIVAGTPTEVILSNIFDFSIPLPVAPTIHYNTIEDMLIDGWKVD